MKKYLFFASVLFLLAACDNDEPVETYTYETVGLTSEIAISNVESVFSKISEVALVARFHAFGNTYTGSTSNADGKDTRVMLKVPFDSKTTRLILPENPPQELLGSITTDFPAGFQISDPEASTIAFVEVACNISETNKFSEFLFQYMDTGKQRYVVQYIYCDRPATITGLGLDWWNQTTTYDLSLQKGWNMVVEKTIYSKDSQTKTVTHLMPEGIKWMQNMWVGER